MEISFKTPLGKEIYPLWKAIFTPPPWNKHILNPILNTTQYTIKAFISKTPYGKRLYPICPLWKNVIHPMEKRYAPYGKITSPLSKNMPLWKNYVLLLWKKCCAPMEKLYAPYGYQFSPFPTNILSSNDFLFHNIKCHCVAISHFVQKLLN